MSSAPDTPNNPYRFPPLAEDRYWARKHAEKGQGHGLSQEVRPLADGAAEVVYSDGHVEVFSAQEMQAQEERRAQHDADHALIYGPPPETMAEAIHVIQVEIPYTPPTPEQTELLADAASLLDSLDELGQEAAQELTRLLNRYGVERFATFPLFEVYATPSSWPRRRALGYRLNAFQAALIPEEPIDYVAEEGEEERHLRWSTVEGLRQLDRMVEVLADGADELVDDTRILCERGPDLPFYLVRDGHVYERRDWEPLYRALEQGGQLVKPAPELLTPVVAASSYETRAVSVAALMAQAEQAMADDEQEALVDGDGMVSDELLRAFERLADYYGGPSRQLDRLNRRALKRDRRQETWAALLELRAQYRALLPAWEEPETSDETLLLCQSFEALDQQLRHYHAARPDLALDPLPARDSLLPSVEPKRLEPADGSPGFFAFRRFERESWTEPACWWAQVDADTLASLRGQWVALDESLDVLAAGDDPETLKGAPGWRYIVSVPEEGFADGLVIANDLPATVDDES